MRRLLGQPLINPLGRDAPEPNPQFIAPQIGRNGAAGRGARIDQIQMLPPTAVELPVTGGITQKIANTGAFAKIIDFSIDTVANQSTGFLLATDAYRNFLMLRNASAAANIYIGFNNDASTRSTVWLPPSGVILFDVSVPQDDMYYFADAANGILCCAYSTFKPDWKL